MKKAIGRLARSGGNNGVVAAELGKLNEEFGQVQNDLEKVGQAVDALRAGGPNENDVRQAIQKLDPLWDELFPAEKERIVRLLVQEVALSPDGLLIRLRLNGLNSLVAELQGQSPAEVAGDGQTVDIQVPLEFKVRGGRKEIILPAGVTTEPEAKQNRTLVLAIARAHRWQRMLDSGEIPSVEAIAAKTGVDRTYIGRLLGLAVLAPDIVQAILAGNEPSGLSLTKLFKGVPERWDEQRGRWTAAENAS